MYLAPLNYDRFFRKIFSDLETARAFLQDFLDIEIIEIQPLKEKHRLSDDAKVVEFDFRCRTEQGTFIVDMQQWYKADLVHRFYIYHCLNTGLQLEDLRHKSFGQNQLDKNERRLIDYSELEPAITLVWLVSEKLESQENVLSYKMLPQAVERFLKDETLWGDQCIKDLMRQRQKVLGLMNNKSKNLDFLGANKLIFAIQPNIITSSATDPAMKRYQKWFSFAEKTRRKENQKQDFQEFQGDRIFEGMIRRLLCDALAQDEREYILTESEKLEEYERWERGLRKMAFSEGVEKGKAEGKAEGIAEGIAKGKAEEEAKRKEAEKKSQQEEAKRKDTEKKLNDALERLIASGLSESQAKEILGI